MKKLSIALAVAASFTMGALAKEVTLKGEGKCLKCALKKAEKCQNVLEVKEKDSDKTTLYIMTGDVSGKFHGEICSKVKDIEVTGEVSEKDGKKSILVAKIAEKAKK
jgi:hypothetical protein